LAREADDQEVARYLELLRELQETHQLNADEALERFCLVVLNLNEFIYID
jgi:hypothetical protein